MNVAILQDASFAWRHLRKRPGFLALTTLILGLGIGASTAIFSILSPLLLESLPFPEADRLVWIANTGEGDDMSSVTSRTSNLRDFRERSRSFSGITGYFAFFDQNTYDLTGAGRPERLVGVGVAQDFLTVLGVEPAAGRSFTPEEGLSGGPRALLLTDSFWRQRFAASPDLVGSALTLNGEPYEVVGVLPPELDFSSIFVPGTRVDFLTTFAIDERTDRWGNTLALIGRLRPGVTAEAAQSELDVVVRNLQEENPERWGLGARVSGLQEHLSRPHRAGLLLLAGAALVVLAIVCVNLSSLLLARGPSRRKELALRTALGASRARLVRQLVFESLILALCGALPGLLVAFVVTRLVARTTAVSIPLLASVQVDGVVLLFAVAAAALTGIVVGLAPALRLSRRGVAAAAGGGRGAVGAGRSHRLREIMVVAQVGLACALLLAGGLLVASLRAVLTVDLGYRPANAMAWTISRPQGMDEHEAEIASYERLAEDVAALPGVEAVGFSDALPLGINRNWSVRRPGTLEEDEDLVGFYPHVVDHRYVETMGIPLRRGRLLTPADRADTRPVVLINETAARRLFPGERALGRTLDFGWRQVDVVGVVGDVRHEALELASGPEIYFPYTQSRDFGRLHLVVRSRLEPSALAPAVSAALERWAPGMPTGDFTTLESAIRREASPRRFTLTVLGAFALAALVLAALGVYGVLGCMVSARRPEIGLRIALGESKGRIGRRVLGRTLALTGAGIVLGLAATAAGSRSLEALLFGVAPADPLIALAVVAILLAASVLAGWLPARSAARTDPARVLTGD